MIILNVGIEVFVCVLQEVQGHDAFSKLSCNVQRNETFSGSLSKVSLEFEIENSENFQIAEHASQMNRLNVWGGMLLGAN